MAVPVMAVPVMACCTVACAALVEALPAKANPVKALLHICVYIYIPFLKFIRLSSKALQTWTQSLVFFVAI
jgi:hypothetical protein